MKKLLILSLLFISFTSCRVAKKEWVKENFTEKSTVKESLTVQSDSINKRLEQLSESFNSKLKSISESKSSSSSESESESTNVTGTITAEDGKEKSVTINGTTIKSNGANISFETNSNKAISKEFKENFDQLTAELQTESSKRFQLEVEVRSLYSRLSELESNKEASKTTKSKEVTKRGFSFGVWLFFLLFGIAICTIWYFRKSIPFLS